jgi:hypothetical protein
MSRRLYVEKMTRQAGTPRVDAAAGIIYDVKFLGNESENGRHYGIECRRKALPLYEGVAVNRNHPTDRRKLDRKLEDWVGILENVRAEADGNYGNLRLRKKHEDFEPLIEAAQEFWRNFGLSHVAFGDGKKVNGIEDVRTIEEVRSVDIVFDPATCVNLFESKGRRMTTATKPKRRMRTLAQIIESTGNVKGDALRFRKLLQESTEGESPAVPADTPVAVAEGGSSDDAVKAGILSAIMAKLADADGATVEKVAKALGMGTKLGDMLGGGSAPAEAPASDNPGQEPEAMKESKAFREMKARIFLLESGRKPNDVMVRALAACETNDEAKLLIESWPVAGSEPAPKGKGKPKASPPAFLGDDEDEPADELALIESRFEERAKAAKALLESRRR